MAHHYDAAFFETSAAEDFGAVERVFHEAIREVLREQERYMPIRSLYINNDDSKNNGFLTISGNYSHFLPMQIYKQKFIIKHKSNMLKDN